jgi:hypothetical protein
MQDILVDRDQHHMQQPLRGGNPQARELSLVPYPPPVNWRGW